MSRSRAVLLGLSSLVLACSSSATDTDSTSPGSGTEEGGTTAGTSASTSTTGEQSCGGTVEISGLAAGHLYIDGRYTGLSAPRVIELELDSTHELAVAVPGGAYYSREITVEDSLCTVELETSDRVGPTTWRALWIGVPAAEAAVEGQLCQASASQAELDAAFADFEWSLTEHFARYAHETMTWEVVRQDTIAPVTVTGSDQWFDIHPGDVAEVWDMVEQGDFDVIVTAWKSRDNGCTIPGGYFGLGWSPQPETKQSGFVSIKFDTDDIAATIAWHHENDPGVWVHEWLHTVVEAFYPNLGLPHPAPGGDGLILHAAGDYGYEAPWMTWYEDFMGGRVVEGESFVGIGPAALAACTVRQHALDPCPAFE